MSELDQKSLKFPMGRGGQAYLGIFPKFFRFFYDGSPDDLCQKTRREPAPSVRIHIGSVSEQHHTKIAMIKSEHFLSINNGITTTCLKAHDIYLSYLVSRAPHKDSKVTVNYFLDLARR